jgi:nicotinamidase-related amidase
VGELLVTGIRTEQCCETTTRHASDLGFQVRYVTDATLTFPMQTRSGRKFSTAEIRERTELVLDGRFASIVSTAEAFA